MYTLSALFTFSLDYFVNNGGAQREQGKVVPSTSECKNGTTSPCLYCTRATATVETALFYPRAQGIPPSAPPSPLQVLFRITGCDRKTLEEMSEDNANGTLKHVSQRTRPLLTLFFHQSVPLAATVAFCGEVRLYSSSVLVLLIL